MFWSVILYYPGKYSDKSTELRSSEQRHVTLIQDIKKWSQWILGHVKSELESYYPNTDGSQTIGYIWARTLPCKNPSCGINIPLMRSFWLSNKSNKSIFLFPVIRNRKVEFEIINSPNKVPKFDPNKGTVSRALITCPNCLSVIDEKTTRSLFQANKNREEMVCIIVKNKTETGKRYRKPTQQDISAFTQSIKKLSEKRDILSNEWGIDAVPDEELPLMSGTFNVPLYGMTKWGDLFNSRQKLSLITFAQWVREAYTAMTKEGYNEDYAKALSAYLAIILDRLADKNSNLVPYIAVSETIEHVFSRNLLKGLEWCD